MRILYLFTITIGLACLVPLLAKIQVQIWGDDHQRSTCPLMTSYDRGVQPYTYCLPLNGTNAKIIIPLRGIGTYCYTCKPVRILSQRQLRGGHLYYDSYWYAGAPPLKYRPGNPYEEGWNSVFLYTYYPGHRDTSYSWSLTERAKEYRKLFPKMTANATHIVLDVKPNTPGCTYFGLSPVQDGPDAYFKVQVCILDPKAKPDVTGGNPALGIKQRLIPPVVTPQKDPTPTSEAYAANWMDHDQEDHDSPLHVNLWWRYANLTAHRAGKRNCYVCSILPHAVSQPHLYATPLSELHSDHIINQTLGMHTSESEGPQYDPLQALAYVENVGLRVTLNHNNMDHCDGVNGTCFQVCVNLTGPARTKIRKIDPKHCGRIRDISPTTNTTALDRIWWMCGWRVYMSIPKNSTTVCAPVMVTDYTYIITQEEISTHSRSKRYVTFEPHDPIWGSDVPDGYKQHSTGTKVLLSLFPQLGVGKALLKLDTLDYRLQSFLNASILLEAAQNREISAIRLMVLQNRMALDLSLAPQGGVCAVVGEHCCTYIPDENGTILDVMHTMKNLRAAMSQDPVTQPGWMDWFFTGSWQQILLKAILPFVFVFVMIILTLAMCSCCVIPLLKRTMRNIFLTQIYHFNQIPLQEWSPDTDPILI